MLNHMYTLCLYQSGFTDIINLGLFAAKNFNARTSLASWAGWEINVSIDISPLNVQYPESEFIIIIYSCYQRD